MKQIPRILEYLKTHQGITQKEASDHLGCMRLSERIRELAAMGYKVDKRWEEGQNRFGERERHMRYFVTKKEAA